MNFIPKAPNEVIPLIFDFRSRLGQLAPGAVIVPPIQELIVTPPGSLSIGLPDEALIDEASELEVAVVATGGISPKLYTCTCRADIQHSGGEYVFEVSLHVFVR